MYTIAWQKPNKLCDPLSKKPTVFAKYFNLLLKCIEV